jgi:hypothetical protein
MEVSLKTDNSGRASGLAIRQKKFINIMAEYIWNQPWKKALKFFLQLQKRPAV